MRTTDARLRPYLDELERLPFVRRAQSVDGQGGSRTPAFVSLATPDGTTTVPVELTASHLTAAAAEHVKVLAGERPGLLLLAPAIGSDLGEELAAAGVNFMDLAGNCSVRLGDRYIARIQGRRLQRRAPAEKALRAPAYRVLCALLAKPDLVGAPARALAAAAGGVSPQTANDVRHRLVARRFLLPSRDRWLWAPDGYQGGLELFVGGFSTLLPSLTVGRYRARGKTTDEVEASIRPGLDAVGDWRWGGAAGAWRVTGLYRGDQVVVYIRDPQPTGIANLPLIPAADGNVTLRRPPALAAFEGPAPDTVHPVLLYADLLAEGNSRAHEAAAEIHRVLLARAAVRP